MRKALTRQIYLNKVRLTEKNTTIKEFGIKINLKKLFEIM